MKARIKATGEIINVEQYGDAYAEVLSSCSEENFPEVYNFDELEFINEPDWQQVRIQAAIAAMPIVADDGYNVRNEQHLIAKYAVELADALINELQKKGEQQC